MSEPGGTAVREHEQPGEHDLLESADGGEREHDLRRWFLLTGNRRFVTLALVGLVFAALAIGGNVWSFEMRRLLNETNTVQTLFNTLLSGIILLVSIVVSITSVVLSQELGSLGTHFERVQNSLDFRGSLEEVSDERISPSVADRFLGFVLETVRGRALRLQAAVEDHPNGELRAHAEQLVTAVDDDLDVVNERLSPLNLDRPNVLLAGLEYDYAGQLYAARFIRRNYADELDDEQREAVEAFADALNYFAASREYFKTLFFKRELADLTSTLLYVSLPAILFTSYVLLALDARMFPEVSLFGLSILLLFVSVAFTVALAPFLVLTAYVLRTAFVARRSLEIGPFNVRPDVTKPDLELEEW